MLATGSEVRARTPKSATKPEIASPTRFIAVSLERFISVTHQFIQLSSDNRPHRLRLTDSYTRWTDNRGPVNTTRARPDQMAMTISG